MDANELVNVAYDAMSGIDLTAHDRGQIYGVLQMALRTLETQHESLLAEADEEAAATMRTLVDTQQELIAAKAERDGWRSEASELQKRIDASNAELSRAYADRDLFRRERDQVRSQIDEMAERRGPLYSHSEFAELVKERDELLSMVAARDETITGLQAENARLHRSLEERMSARIPGAVQVAKTDELHGMAKVYLVPAGADDL